jgi:hypothetical protein
MTALDAKFRALATKLITKNGKSVTFASVTAGEYNPSISEVTNTSISATVKAIVEDYDLHSSGAGFSSGLIFSGDKKFSIAAAGITKPKPGDKITLDGVFYSVMRVTEVWSGEQICLFECQARA